MWTLRSWVRRILGRRLHLPEIPAALEGLAQRGFAPGLVFDVGAYQGDFAREVLRIWPSARVACFEPLQQAADQIESLRASRPGVDLHRGLLGPEFRQEVEFNMAETASSVLREHHATHPVCKVTQWTVDSAVHDWYGGQAPDLLKLDVQGYELHVLKGGNGVLAARRRDPGRGEPARHPPGRPAARRVRGLARRPRLRRVRHLRHDPPAA